MTDSGKKESAAAAVAAAAVAAGEQGAGAAQDLPKVSLEVLSLVRDSHLQNGLRQNDYTRYRRYCSKRLRRIRTSKDVNLRQRKGTKKSKVFEKKDVSADMANLSPAHLSIPLLNAERAWAYSMELKGEAEAEAAKDDGGHESRKRLHLLQRLAKAAKWAKQLQTLCEVRGRDDRREGESRDETERR